MRYSLNLHKSNMIGLGIVYIYIPILLFIICWIKLPLAILACIIITKALRIFIQSIKSEESDDVIKINIIFGVFIFITIFAIGFVCGWSGYGHQTEDWPKHNAILHDLTEKDWPVIYKNNNDISMLTYYIGQYIVPAFIGKTVGLDFQGTLCVNWIWSSLGVCLVWLIFLFAAKANTTYKQLCAIILIMLGGGMMTLQQEIGHAVFPNEILLGMDGWRDYFLCFGRYMLQYRTNFIALRWAYGQTIVIWICVTIFYQKNFDIKNYMVMLIPAVLFGTFSFVSLVFLAIASYIVYIKRIHCFKQIIKSTFSIQNCLIFFSIGIVLFLYYYGFIIQEKPEGVGFELVTYSGKDLSIYIIFISGSFLIYALCVFKENYGNIIYLSSIIIMSVLPFVKFGVANDLLMGACIGPSFILYIVLAKFIFNQSNSKTYIQRRAVLLVLLCIGFIKPAIEIYHCLTQYDYSEYVPNDSFVTLEGFANRERTDIGIDVQYNYYTYDAYESLFMKYIGKQ